MSKFNLKERLDGTISYMEHQEKTNPEDGKWSLLVSYLIDIRDDCLPSWVTEEV